MEQGRPTSLRLSNQVKLIPRDINESLGKLPPQAIDLEEMVIGAILTEKSAFYDVKDILRHDHFYREAHREIYAAVQDLALQQKPIDLKTVIYALRNTGKIELVGGPYYVTELSTRVSSSANIVAHARIVREMAIKRKMFDHFL